tara:strand:+ start:503 stop:1015 length:513 start_codon:yes stop_codon:yes gene_type:complete
MRKLITIITFLLLIISCEKDDICTSTDANTANLKIKFYNNLDRDVLKKVNNLLIVGNSLSYGIESSRDSISIPLRILENNTSYKLIKDYIINDNGTPDDLTDDFATGNEDEIIINYENEEIFISKACGFKNVFNNVNFGFTDDDDNWILNTSVINNKIENENDAHIHIFH